MSPDDLIHRPAQSASDLAQAMAEIGRRAREAASRLALASADAKTAALKAAGAAIRSRANEILSANAEDLAAAKQAGIGDALLDRLALDPKRLEAVARGWRTSPPNPTRSAASLRSGLAPMGSASPA
jgi:glutamate-5-semialdehyde dehydrogenase